MAFLGYMDNDFGLQPSSYPYILGMALNHYKIKPKDSICFRLQSGQENWLFNVNKNRDGCVIK